MWQAVSAKVKFLNPVYSLVIFPIKRINLSNFLSNIYNKSLKYLQRPLRLSQFGTFPLEQLSFDLCTIS